MITKRKNIVFINRLDEYYLRYMNPENSLVTSGMVLDWKPDGAPPAGESPFWTAEQLSQPEGVAKELHQMGFRLKVQNPDEKDIGAASVELYNLFSGKLHLSLHITVPDSGSYSRLGLSDSESGKRVIKTLVGLSAQEETRGRSRYPHEKIRTWLMRFITTSGIYQAWGADSSLGLVAYLNQKKPVAADILPDQFLLFMRETIVYETRPLRNQIYTFINYPDLSEAIIRHMLSLEAKRQQRTFATIRDYSELIKAFSRCIRIEAKSLLDGL